MTRVMGGRGGEQGDRRFARVARRCAVRHEDHLPRTGPVQISSRRKLHTRDWPCAITAAGQVNLRLPVWRDLAYEQTPADSQSAA